MVSFGEVFRATSFSGKYYQPGLFVLLCSVLALISLYDMVLPTRVFIPTILLDELESIVMP